MATSKGKSHDTSARVVSAPSAISDMAVRRSVRDKIKTIGELAEISARARREKSVVVLAHGTFDLLHMGHVRHLERAKHEGDLLIVTITGDKFVNKGPGRPVFTSNLRAEMVAALAYVDYVGVNEAPSAEGLLAQVQPTVYVKGSDYADASDDITGKIAEERKAVEAHGGRVLFTNDIRFSSSELLNRHFGNQDPELASFLERHRNEGTLARLVNLIDRVRDYRVLFVGDTIIDEYHYVEAMGKSPKENLIATLYDSRELFAGGVIAAANHAASFCKDVEVVTGFGEIDGHEAFVRDHVKPNVKVHGVYRPGIPTTRKLRYVDRDYLRKLFEVYFMKDAPMTGVVEDAFTEEIRKRAKDFDAVVVTDFGHGLITSKVISTLFEHAPFLAVNAQSNSANHGFNLITKYTKADYICIDAPEARLAVADRYADLETTAASNLPSRIQCDRIILTHGKHGCVVYDGNGYPRRIPAFTNTVVDTIGAGDAFLAVTSPLVATGEDMELVGFIGNAVGAMKVGIVGHRQSIEKVPLLKYLNTILK